uniref:Odorant receptor n=1 Tax=Lutzomyia longipalpis TaxID=7200 RepID=A0A3F2ZD82_LUTLO
MTRSFEEFAKTKPLIDYLIAISTLDVLSISWKNRFKIISLIVSHYFYITFMYNNIRSSISSQINLNFMWTFLIFLVLSDYIAIMILNIFKRKKFHVLMQNIRELFEEEEGDEDLGGILNGHLMYNLRFFNFLQCWELRLGFVLITLAGLNFRLDHDFGLIIEIPFIVSDNTLWLECQYVLQTTFGAAAAYNMISINLGISFLGLSIIAEFNILTDYMKLVNEKIKTDPKFLSKIIKRHCSVIENVNLLNDIISESSFMQIFANCVIFLFGFSFLMKSSYSFANYMILVAGLMLSVHVCVLGHFIRKKADKLSDTLYLNNWYELSLVDQKTFMIILGMAQRGYGLKAAGMYDVTLYTLVQISNIGFSYCAILYSLCL